MSSGGWRVDGETRHTHDPAAAAGQLTFVWDGSCRRWHAASAPISVSIVHLHHSGPAAAFDEIQPRRSHPVWSSNQCTGEWLLLFYLHRAQSLVLDRAILFCLARPSRWQRTCGLNNLQQNRSEPAWWSCDSIFWTTCEILQFPIRQRKVHGANRYRTPRNTRAPLLCPNPHAVPRIPFCPPLSGINVRRRFDSIPFHQHVPSKLNQPANHRAAALLVSRIRRQPSTTRAHII
jgi:hypothetical protein